MKEKNKAPVEKNEIQATKTASCPSLSGKSTITYDIGSQGDSQYIRLSGNSAGGLFCKLWIPLTDIQKLLSGSPKLTSKTFQPLYAGKSANSPGFLLACVFQERLAERPTADPVPSPLPQKESPKGKKKGAPTADSQENSE